MKTHVVAQNLKVGDIIFTFSKVKYKILDIEKRGDNIVATIKDTKSGVEFEGVSWPIGWKVSIVSQ